MLPIVFPTTFIIINTIFSNVKSVDNVKLKDKLTDGEKLFTDILHKVHGGNINEMFVYLKDCYDKIDIYGNTPEKALINYCAFQPSAVLQYYNVKSM